MIIAIKRSLVSLMAMAVVLGSSTLAASPAVAENQAPPTTQYERTVCTDIGNGDLCIKGSGVRNSQGT
jgi:hypothetical protein